jgi:hypothetical protein
VILEFLVGMGVLRETLFVIVYLPRTSVLSAVLYGRIYRSGIVDVSNAGCSILFSILGSRY